MSRIAIVGGGISGLASAGLLAREGHEVTLFEQAPQVGGRASSWEHDGFRFDLGPSWYLMPEVFDHFFRLMGTSAAEQLDLVPLDPGYRVYFEGQREPLDIPHGLERNVDLFESVEKGAGSRIRRYLASSRDTYDMAKKRFLYTSFPTWAPLLRADVVRRLPTLARLLLQHLDTFVAGTVNDPRLAQVLGYPAVFLGSSPYRTPSMYHLMSTLDLDDGVLYPMGGLTRVIERIAALAVEAGVRVETSATVTRIRTSDAAPGRRPHATGLDWTDSSGATRSFAADLVVSAADLHHTETALLPRELQTYGEAYWRHRDPGPSALLMYLGVSGELPELEHHTLLFSRDWHDNFERIFGRSKSIPEPPSLYVCKPSAVDASTAPAGQTNLFVLVPLPADVSLGAGTGLAASAAPAAPGTDSRSGNSGSARLDLLADAVIAQIAEWTGVSDLSSRILFRRTRGPQDFVDDYNSWSGSMLGPAHTLRQSAMFRAGNVSKKVRGLYYVGGSVRPGIGLPMCLISAEILVKNLRGDTSTEPLPEPTAEAAPAPVRASGSGNSGSTLRASKS
ncbi:phytoene desaturase family protein [Frondihabitans australicus]|uniref:Phytoene desaturase n=1 Tax=Frondihabitans australicus TaxID=386892 RepID=A0A495IJX5_9MICO|nr:phytoene desaturase family protein [Frondihabitans australicus]RKR76099.1 phytoene desaturase [Frondihabitans australicus]